MLSADSDATEKFGEQLGRKLRGGEVIELISDLGGGKTTFVRGLARGAGSNDQVASPTFTLSKIYKTTNFDIHHFDFYRLEQAGLASYELEDLIGDPKVVIIIEWGSVVQHVLPSLRLTVTVNKLDDDNRELIYNYPPQLSYLLAAKEV